MMIEMTPLDDAHNEDPAEAETDLSRAQSKSRLLCESRARPQSRTPSDESRQKETSKVQKPPRRSIWLDTWLLESIALAFAIACFIAICIVLLIYDKKVRPETMLYDLTLNTFVSVLATGCKSALVLVVGEAISQLKWLWFHNPTRDANERQLLDIQTFDAASRGPLGSLMILIHHRAHSFVSLGAVVILLLLAFDPFIQQALNYPVQLAPDLNGVAIAPQLREFMPGNSTLDPTSSPRTLLLDTALSQGFWSDQAFIPSPQCSSGNCTWGEYSSSGFCSRCIDITSLATLDCHLPNAVGSFNKTCHISLPYDYEMFDHEFDSGYNFTVAYHESEDWEMGAPVLFFPDKIVWQPLSYLQGDFDDSIATKLQNTTFADVMNPLWSNAYAELELHKGPVSADAPISDGLYIKSVTGCSLSACLRDYNVTVENGHPSFQTLTIDFGTVYLDSTKPRRPLCWRPGPPNVAGHQDTRGFNFCDTRMELLAGKGSKYFPSEEVGAWELEGRTWKKLPMGASEVYDTDNFDPSLDRLRTTGFARSMANMAASLNKVGLENSNHGISGTVYTTKVFVSVQWRWIILPALLVFIGTAFSCATIIVSRRSNLPLWKSSALAPFYHGLEKLGDDHYVTASIMEKQAERENVQLQRLDHNGRLMLRQREAEALRPNLGLP